MLPPHGKIECRRCFAPSDGQSCKPHPEWKMVNDPGAWGGGAEPDFLVLGFSKGQAQAGVYESGRFEDVAFARMRPRLTAILKAMVALAPTETVDAKISNPNSNIAFGSLIRCSVTRYDAAASKRRGAATYGATGALITKSFGEIPKVLSACAEAYLRDLPPSIKVVFMLGNTDAYVTGCQAVLHDLFPHSFQQINPMSVYADGHVWVHVTHPSGMNGYFNEWLNSDAGSGLKRLQAQSAVLGHAR